MNIRRVLLDKVNVLPSPASNSGASDKSTRRPSCHCSSVAGIQWRFHIAMNLSNLVLKPLARTILTPDPCLCWRLGFGRSFHPPTERAPPVSDVAELTAGEESASEGGQKETESSSGDERSQTEQEELGLTFLHKEFPDLARTDSLQEGGEIDNSERVARQPPESSSFENGDNSHPPSPQS